MTPYYDQDGVTIYHADCREILPTLPKVDLLLTDPPYNASFNADGTKKRGVVCKHKGYAAINQEWDNETVMDVVLAWHGQSLAFCSFHLLGRYLHEKPPHQILHWVKTNPFPALGDYYSFSVEYILWWRDGGAFNRGGYTDVFSFPICGGDERTGHPTQKPQALMEILIAKHTNPGDTILDPFMGSGTTLRAAKNLGRKAIGVEIDERYCEIAVRRLAQSVLPL